MPRIAEARLAAEPNSVEQKDRYQRILTVAARLGAAHGLERMQMHDVAKQAEVAIATLYRYFPSKTHLFTGVLRWQIERLPTRIPPSPRDQGAVGAVAHLLNTATDQLFLQPRLALAMMQSNNAAHADAFPNAGDAELTFRELIMSTAGIEQPTDEHERLVRLVEQCWYGLLMSTLNGRGSREQARTDIRCACELLLAPLVRG